MLKPIALFIFIWIFNVKNYAQSSAELFAGTKTPYHPLQQEYTPVPKGFAPIFVNYVGRHGARFMTKAGADQEALDLIMEADKNFNLTDRGQIVKGGVQKMLQIQRTGYEKITLLGMKEQKDIGQRIFLQYRPAFAGKGIQVQYTYKIRTQQSAEAFLTSFGWYKGIIQTDKNRDSANAELRFYELSPAYTTYKEGRDVQQSLDSLEDHPRTEETVQRICYLLFKKDFADQLILDHRAKKFVENLYDVYAASFAVIDEIKKNGFSADSLQIRTAFTDDDLRWLDFKSGAADFLEKGPGRDSMGIQVKVAAPLLADFLNSTDVAVRSRKMDARFRFTHAEAIAPFAALLSLPEASETSASIFQYDHFWKTSEIIPLSANIQWILYSDGRNYLVKVLLNEKEVKLPIVSSTAPYYVYQEVRDFFLKKLQTLGARQDGDMISYLKTLKP